jgi:hypothetical protein
VAHHAPLSAQCGSEPRQGLPLTSLMSCPDERHEQFEGTDQRQGWPCADQGTYRPVAQAMRQVGANRRHDADAKAPAGQAWYTLVAAAGVQDDHTGRPDKAIHSEGQEPGGRTRLSMRAHELVGVLI